MKFILLATTLLTTLFISGCTDKENKESITKDAMKCGPGKCGASMVDGSAVLVKKKMNILNQLDKNDTRRECILKSLTTKELYSCVRAEETGRLSTKCSADKTKQIPTKSISTMKSEAEKCGSDM